MYLGRYFLFSIFALFVLAGLAVVPSEAQSETPIITVAVPEFFTDVLTDEMLAPFESEHGVDVRVVSGEPFFPSPANAGIDSYLEELQDYASTADVVFASSGVLTPESTRAGLFLDLAPLVNGDPNLNAADFIPAVWQSVQWDNGIWGLPTSADVIVLTYDPEAFDRAGLAYPTEAWTLDDLGNAARALAVVGANGTVTTPGLTLTGESAGILFRSLLGEGFYDASTLPNAPKLTNPALESLLASWVDLVGEGVVSTNFSGDEYTDSPMHIEGSFGLSAGPLADTQRAGALLPGGAAGLDVASFAVSAGTTNPELAYELAKFLTANPVIATGFFNPIPARQSLRNAPADNGGDGQVRIFRPPLSPEAQALTDSALAAALPGSETRFVDYVGAAANNVETNGVDAATALQNAEAQAVNDLQAADAFKTSTTFAVATPVPAPVLQPGEISLNFGVASFIMPFPNREEWDRVIADFVASDPQVGEIVFDIARGDGGDMASQYDCYYLPYNGVPGLDLSTVLNLDPYMDTDASFNRSDVVGNTLAQLQRENHTWAMPMTLQPETLRYDVQQLAAAGVPEPTGGWTVDSFVDALEMLKVNTGDNSPFSGDDPSGNYLLMLAAAYGGLPIDYRTNPPTVNFTDPASVQALQQVLDLAKNGLIDYQELGTIGGRMVLATGGDEPPITTQLFGGMGVEIRRGDGPQIEYGTANFPTGSQYNAISYSIGTGYISATSQNPDACYRWLSTIATHTELFGGMPARRSLINDPALANAQGADTVAVYQQIDALLQQPNTIVFPNGFGDDTSSLVNFASRLWLNRAFDNYVLNDADLATELAQAQSYFTDFQGCMAQIPPFDPTTQDRQDYFNQAIQCAVQVDPSLSSMLQFVQ